MKRSSLLLFLHQRTSFQLCPGPFLPFLSSHLNNHIVNMLCRRALSIFLLVVAPVTQAANLCFFPGGKQAADVPCDLKAQVSMCCGSVAACLSNGLCKDEKTTNETGVAYARGTCTDPTWQSPICPQHCQLSMSCVSLQAWSKWPLLAWG